MKQCYNCKRNLTADLFYKNKSKQDGLSSLCKECQMAWRRSHYHCNKEKTDATVAEWRALNKEKVKQYAKASSKKKYNATKNGGLYLVYHYVKIAIKNGILVPEPCRICGETKVHAHHQDYKKPLDVLWYCQKHHRRLHEIIGSRLHTLMDGQPPPPK